MKKLIATIALSVTLAGCGTSLTYNNGDINWKAVAVSTGVFVAGVLLCNEFCEVGHDVRVSGGELTVQVDAEWSQEDSERFRNDVEYLKGVQLPSLPDISTISLPEVASLQQ